MVQVKLLKRALELRQGDARRNRRGLRLLFKLNYAKRNLLAASYCLRLARNG